MEKTKRKGKVEKVYSFKVLDEIKKGQTIYFMDLLNVTSPRICNDMAVKDLVILIEKADEDKTGRNLFWKIVTVEE